MECTRTPPERSRESRTALDLEGLSERFQFAVALLGQLNCRITHHRRVNSLTGVPGYSSRKVAEEHGRARKDILQQDLHGSLFGQQFGRSIRQTQLQAHQLAPNATGTKRKASQPFRGGRGDKGARSGQQQFNAQNCSSQATNWQNGPWNRRGGQPGRGEEEDAASARHLLEHSPLLPEVSPLKLSHVPPGIRNILPQKLKGL